MIEKEVQAVSADHVVVDMPAEWLAPQTERPPEPEPKYSPDDPEFKKAVMAIVLDMQRKRIIR